jgi:diguanylate cyclase (GGDEF)-like protein
VWRVDLFEKEQLVYNRALKYLSERNDDDEINVAEFTAIVKSYGQFLKQMRRLTKTADANAMNLLRQTFELSDKVNYDALTGIFNRRYINENLPRLLKTLSRSGGLLSVAMLDIDHFKNYNDIYGHGEGDMCIKLIAQSIFDSLLREDDFAARYGGEEFLIVLPNTDEKGAQSTVERIFKNVANHKILHEGNSAAPYVTISAGFTTAFVKPNHNADAYMKCADDALYFSKQNGRNRYTFYEYKEIDN